MIRTAAPSTEMLDRQIETLVAADRPAEVFKTLLESSRIAAPRAAVFLVRQGRIKAWGCVGYDAQTGKQFRAFSVPADVGWLGELVQSTEGNLAERQGTGTDPDFGQSAAVETLAIAVRVKRRTIALLLAERPTVGDAFCPPVLRTLVRVAQLRLDLNLLGRKTRPAAAVTAPARAAEASAPPVSSTAPAAEAKELSPVSDTPSDDAVDKAQLETARRFARLVATDIRLYNEESVVLGRRHGDLASRLAEHLTRGEETFMQRHGSLGPAARRLLREAFVQMLAGGDENLLPTDD